MGSELKPLPDVARNAGATVDQLRYWLRILEIKVTKQGKTRMVSAKAAEQLSSMAQMVRDGTSPKDAANHILSTPLPAAATPKTQELPIVSELSEVKKVLMVMAETMNSMRSEMARMSEENRALRQETASLRTLFLPPAGSPRGVVTPPAKREPVQRELSFLESCRLSFDDCMGFIFGKG